MQRLHSKTSHFVIVSLDVNELKETNDSYGHAQGDRLLKGFADILATCFGEEAYLIGRMGGDEFIAIFKEKPESRVRVLLQELTQQMSVESGRDYRLAYAAAYGVATSKEMPDSSAHDIYMVADSRMYADKKAGKKDKEGNAQMTGGQTDA